jgi:hypothetical protein
MRCQRNPHFQQRQRQHGVLATVVFQFKKLFYFLKDRALKIFARFIVLNI